MQTSRGKGHVSGRQTLSGKMDFATLSREQNTRCECCSTLVPVLSITKGGHNLYFRDYRCENPDCASHGSTQAAKSTRRYLRILR